jgi:hypothetical protein
MVSFCTQKTNIKKMSSFSPKRESLGRLSLALHRLQLKPCSLFFLFIYFFWLYGLTTLKETLRNGSNHFYIFIWFHKVLTKFAFCRTAIFISVDFEIFHVLLFASLLTYRILSKLIWFSFCCHTCSVRKILGLKYVRER